MKNLITILFVLVLSACSSVNTKNVETKEQIQSNTINDTQLEHTDLIKINNCKNCNLKDFNGTPYSEKINKAKAIMEELLPSKCFKDEFLKVDLIDNQDMSNEYALGFINNSYAVVDIEMYYKRLTKTHGYTKPGWTLIKLNRKYHYNYGYCSSASNLAHEWTHKIGFTHAYKPNSIRPRSIPYATGRIINFCCEKKYGKKY